MIEGKGCVSGENNCHLFGPGACRPRRRAAARLLAGAVLAELPPSGARAADVSWNNPSGGSFQAPANWSTHSVPTAGDNAIFDLASANPYAVSFSGDAQSSMLSVGNNVTFNLAA